MSDDTIVAVATPPGNGAIAIVRMSGSAAHAIAQKMLSDTVLHPHRARRVRIVDERGQTLDRGLALVARGPHSYTGEDTVEFHVHGSPVVAREVVRVALVFGARLATPGEFTQRAFLNGKIDLHAAAAVADLIDAQTAGAARAAAANLTGALSAHVSHLRVSLARVVEDCSGAVDFPDEIPDPDRGQVRATIDAIAGELERLRAHGEHGRLVREGVAVAIVGPPNAGKSSLLNALLEEERAIVSEVAGTTRDTIEETLSIDGVPVRLVDTAGIREHADMLEAQGIARTHRALDDAHIALLVFDASHPLDDASRRLLDDTHDRARIVFYNKCDLGRTLSDCDGECIAGSVYDRATVEALRRAIARVGWGGTLPDLSRPHLASLRELDAVARALNALDAARETLDAEQPIDLIVGDIQTAFAALGHISGDAVAGDVLDAVFARFCIGK